MEFWQFFLPTTDSLLLQNRIGLVISVCVILVMLTLVLITTWAITGDLQRETVFVATIYSGILFLISLIAYWMYWQIATWLLVVVLIVSIGADTFYFGVSSPAIVSFSLPMLITSFNQGVVASILLTFTVILFIWFCALSEKAEWYQPKLGKDISHQTFNAPVLTVIFLAISLISSWWSSSIIALLG